MSKDQALAKAAELELDLVEIAPNVNPPVAKIVEFQKFKYDEEKKEKAAKKNAREVELKELWLSPRIAEHDLNTRLKRAEKFIEDGDRIMFRVKFKGREMAHTEFGFELLNKIFAKLGDKISIEREPKMEGRSITAIVGKSRGVKKENSVEEKPIDSQDSNQV